MNGTYRCRSTARMELEHLANVDGIPPPKAHSPTARQTNTAGSGRRSRIPRRAATLPEVRSSPSEQTPETCRASGRGACCRSGRILRCTGPDPSGGSGMMRCRARRTGPASCRANRFLHTEPPVRGPGPVHSEMRPERQHAPRPMLGAGLGRLLARRAHAPLKAVAGPTRNAARRPDPAVFVLARRRQVRLRRMDAVDVGEMLQLQRAVLRQRYVPFMIAPESWSALSPEARAVHPVCSARCTAAAGGVGAARRRGLDEALRGGLPPAPHGRCGPARRPPRARQSGVAFSWSKRVPRPEAVHRGSHMNGTAPAGAPAAGSATTGASRCSSGSGSRDVPCATRTSCGAPRPSSRASSNAPAVRPRHALSSSASRGGAPPNHTVAGNPMRFRVGTIRLTVDERGASKLPAARRRLVSLLTRPVARPLRYAGGGRPAARSASGAYA